MRISKNHVNEYIYAKHNILPGTQADTIAQVAKNHLGLHSARIITPYTTLCSRLTNYNTDMLMNSLYTDKELIKLRCMRTTLHIATIDIASLLFMATLDIRLAKCLVFFKKHNINIEEVENYEQLLRGLITSPREPFEIEQTIIRISKIELNAELKKQYAKMVLKYYWEKGVLCYVNEARSWEKEKRKYADTMGFYPKINLYEYTIEEAQEELILKHIHHFGPVTIKDIAWWSGLSIIKVKNVIKKNSDFIQKISIDNFPMDFYISSHEHENLINYKTIDSEWVSLLAYEDPSLKGYFNSRYRYVEEKYYNSLFNQIGEVKASIIHNGNAIGIWEWDKTQKRINETFFFTPSSYVIKEVAQQKERYEYILNKQHQLSLFNIY